MPEKPSVFISSLTFSGGDVFSIGKNEKVILVGPNNSGKSQSLREIESILHHGSSAQRLVISDVGLTKEGDSEALRSFLDSEGEYVGNSYRFHDWNINHQFLPFWDQPYLTRGLMPGFLKRVSADDRLKICEQQSAISPDAQKTKPQHILYDDSGLMGEISSLFKKAFGKNLMFDFRGGSRLPIHVGDLPDIGDCPDRVGDEYVRLVRDNPLLDKQGDGIKSYAGILFESVVADRDITLIDEPEAFLHPPQMRMLGETLSSEVNGQLIVATHSSDIMRGFLEGTQGSVRILRIRREGGLNNVSEASSEVIKELWSRPELRYSNALEGVFHEQTIVCEDDSDCRLINSVADHLSNENGLSFRDTAYVPAGGKHGIPKIAGVLRKIGVPVKAVFDIDFLSERGLVESAVSAFGGQWPDFEPTWARLDSAVRDGVREKSVPEVKREISSILESSEALPKSDVIEAMKQTKPWAQVKKFGKMGIPRGDAQNFYAELEGMLAAIGIFIVPVGEIENFCRDIGSHGPKFVTKLLSDVSLGDEKLGELRGFVTQVQEGECANF